MVQYCGYSQKGYDVVIDAVKAQIIATLHDISLLDCKRMFRKEQIWFTDKDENGTDLYSLKEFSYD